MSTGLADALAIFRREALRYRRDRAYWVGQLAFPVVVVGFIGLGLNDVGTLPTGAHYVSHLAAGILALVVGSGAVGGGFSLIEDRATGFLRALLLAPVSRASIVLGKIAARIVASLLLVGMLVAILATFTELAIPHPAMVLLAVAGVTAVFVALGIGLATLLRRLESFRLVSALVTIPLYLFSGIFYPLSTLAAPLRWAAYANPLTYGVDLLRFGLLDVNEIPVLVSAVMLAVLAAAATALAVRLFDRRALG